MPRDIGNDLCLRRGTNIWRGCSDAYFRPGGHRTGGARPDGPIGSSTHRRVIGGVHADIAQCPTVHRYAGLDQFTAGVNGLGNLDR